MSVIIMECKIMCLVFYSYQVLSLVSTKEIPAASIIVALINVSVEQ